MKECLESVAVQTLTDGVECILVDDCGTDNSIKIAEDFISEYNGPILYSIIHHPHNKGVSAARNTGTKKAKGEFLFFLDSDDTMCPNCLEELYGKALKYPNAEIVIGTANTENGIWQAISGYDGDEFVDDREFLRKCYCLFLIGDVPWNRLVRTEFFKSHNLYFEEGYIQEDTLWSYRIEKVINSVAISKELTYNYRTNPTGIMQSHKNLKEAESFSGITNIAYNDLCNCNDIKYYEVEYLECLLYRAWNTGGIDGVRMLELYRNPLFKLLLCIKNTTYSESIVDRVKRKICRRTVSLIKKALCKKSILALG